jgi:hypothetical protein
MRGLSGWQTPVRPLTITGTNLLGLIKHLATWEADRFEKFGADQWCVRHVDPGPAVRLSSCSCVPGTGFEPAACEAARFQLAVRRKFRCQDASGGVSVAAASLLAVLLWKGLNGRSSHRPAHCTLPHSVTERESLMTQPVKNRVGGLFVPVRDVTKARAWYRELLGNAGR